MLGLAAEKIVVVAVRPIAQTSSRIVLSESAMHSTFLLGSEPS